MTTLAPAPLPVHSDEPPPERPVEPPRARPWRPWAVAALALVLAALMNGPQLVRTAERQPFGWRRDALVDLASDVAEVSEATGLDRPRRWADRLLDRDQGPPPSAPPVTVPSGTTLPPATTAPTTPDTAPDTTATPTTTPTRRRPTAEDPLRVQVVGDSMMHVVGQSVLAATDGIAEVRAALEYRVSTGLTRPDYFDWPARLAEIVANERPDVVVVMFGANDAQGIMTAAGAAPFGSEAWLAEYRTRTAALMDQLVAAGSRVYWVGQPIMRSDSFSARMAQLDEIYRSEAARRPDVVFVDSWSVFAVDGRYSPYLDGDPTPMRQDDGIHLTRAGGDRLAEVIVASIRVDWLEED